jgi:hypothetical protein
MTDKILICDIVVWNKIICQYAVIFNFVSVNEVKIANKTETKRYNSINKKRYKH